MKKCKIPVLNYQISNDQWSDVAATFSHFKCWI